MLRCIGLRARISVSYLMFTLLSNFNNKIFLVSLLKSHAELNTWEYSVSRSFLAMISATKAN